MTKGNDFNAAIEFVADIQDEFIAKLREESKSDKLIYRGIPKKYDSGKIVSSSMYRNAQKDSVKIFDENFFPFNIEEEVVKRAKRFFKHGTGNIEILTELRHFGGDASLVDFSRNLMIALFFSCNGEPKKDGWLIACSEDQFQNLGDVDYQKMLKDKDPFVIEPTITDRSQARTLIQSSIFLYVPGGYIDKKQYKKFKIPHGKKELILNYLRIIHNISEETIYNDLPGFLSNEKSFETASLVFYRGLAKGKSGDHPGAIDEFDKAISYRPNDYIAYYNRGTVKGKKGNHAGAIKDLSKAIQLGFDDASAYCNRGAAKIGNEDYIGAMEDCNRAIQIDPDHADAYCNRGIAKSNIEDYTGAMEDYSRAIEIDPDHAKAYCNRGAAKIENEDNEDYAGAIEDCNRAIQINPDYASAYQNRGVAHEALGQDEAAEEDFRKAEELRKQQEDNSDT